jgi:hypothetical protein
MFVPVRVIQKTVPTDDWFTEVSLSPSYHLPIAWIAVIFWGKWIFPNICTSTLLRVALTGVFR